MPMRGKSRTGAGCPTAAPTDLLSGPGYLLNGSAMLMRGKSKTGAWCPAATPTDPLSGRGYLLNGSAMPMRGKSLTCRTTCPKDLRVYDPRSEPGK